jgi:hypothetical protein
MHRCITQVKDNPDKFDYGSKKKDYEQYLINKVREMKQKNAMTAGEEGSGDGTPNNGLKRKDDKDYARRFVMMDNEMGRSQETPQQTKLRESKAIMEKI